MAALLSAALSTTSALISELRNRWRELTNEKNTTVVPDSDVDDYMDAGAEALNRRIGYHYTTDTITLTAGTQEYSLFSDCQEVVWVEWLNGRRLEKRDMEDWQRKGEDWRGEEQGAPLEWAQYANKIILKPTPSADAVASGSTITVRYVSKPASFTTSGFAQLSTAYHNVALYYAVAEWFAAYLNAATASAQYEMFTKKFDTEATAAGDAEKRKEIAR